MKPITQQIKALLRGEVDARQLAASGARSPMGPSLLSVIVVSGAFYGACTGFFAFLRGADVPGWHVLGVMLKVPLLFLLTLLVTVPSMYVFAALARVEWPFRQTVRLMLASSALSSVALASFGPVTVFFTCSTKSHSFMLLLNLVFFAIAGWIGLAYLARNMRAARRDKESSKTRPVPFAVRIWFLIYGVVGLQMGWLLRPFVGNPEAPIQFLRETSGDALRGILDALAHL